MATVLEKPAITIEDNLAVVTFDRFDLDNYGLFLKCKRLPESQIEYRWETDTYRVTTPARFAPLLGAQEALHAEPWLPLAAHLFDYQQFVVRKALEAERYAVWLDTGLGKMSVGIEWARQVMHRTRSRVLYLSPLPIIKQVQDEATRFYGDTLAIERVDSREALAKWCKEPNPAVGICNYEKLIPGVLNEFRYLGGIVADEAGILKSGGGVIKWNLIKSAKGVAFKLSMTATPAPNDTMEYASQASFLEKLRTEGDILWTFFTRDKQGNWMVRPYARAAFYEFMASWSIYLRDPAHLGFNDILSTLPPPEIIEHRIEITPVQRELMYGFLVKSNKGLFSDDRLGVTERSKLSQLAKGFLYEKGKPQRAVRIDSRKPAKVAEIVRGDVADGRQVLVWTVFDEESDIIAEELAGSPFTVATLDGEMKDDDRLATISDFKTGKIQVLISKAALLGYGLNLQNCKAMVFSGFDDSFERMYQATRRCYRFGQTESVRVHTVYIPELEGMIFSNVKAKEAAFFRDVSECEENYRKVLAAELAAVRGVA